MDQSNYNRNKCIRLLCRAAGCILVGLMILTSAGADELEDSYQRRIQSLARGYYDAADWARLMQDLQKEQESAEKQGDWDRAIEAGLLQAQAHCELRNDDERAMALLEKLKVIYGEKESQKMREVYVMQAGVYASRSDPQGITRLILEFKNSSSYDGEPFAYSGGTGRDDPLVVTRPHARGSDSLTVTAMEKLRRQALMGRGQRVPALQIEAVSGKSYSLDALPWKVTLIDFWLGKWTPWQRSVPYLEKAYDEYRREGFGILGISLDRDPASGLALLEKYDARWPQVMDPKGKIARQFGLFGEASNILVDENGFIIGRNVRGEDLSATIRGVLGLDSEE